MAASRALALISKIGDMPENTDPVAENVEMIETKALDRPANAIVLTPEQMKELVLTSNHLTAVSIQGVAHGRVRRTDIHQYFIIYEIAGQQGRFAINEDLYRALKTIFDKLLAGNPTAVQMAIHGR